MRFCVPAVCYQVSYSMYRILQGNAVLCCAVLRSIVQYSTVQCSPVHYSEVYSGAQLFEHLSIFCYLFCFYHILFDAFLFRFDLLMFLVTCLHSFCFISLSYNFLTVYLNLLSLLYFLFSPTLLTFESLSCPVLSYPILPYPILYSFDY